LSISLASKVTSSILGCFAVLYLGWGLDGYLSTQALVMVAMFPLACWLIRKDLTFKISKKWCEETFKYGYPFIFAGIAFWLLGTVDRWMLTAFTSLEEVSIYSVAFRFSSIILFITTAFGMAWGPLAIKIKSENPSTYKQFYADLLGVFLYLILLVAGLVCLFSGEIIRSLMSDNYMKSAYALILLSLGVGLYGTQQITAMGISIEKKTHLFSRIAWIALILNIVLNYFLIQKFGANGASFSTLISYLFITSAYLFYSEKLHEIPFNKPRLLMLLILGVLVAFVSLEFCLNEFSAKDFLIKIFALIFFTISGFMVIKNNSFMRVKEFRFQ
jgi:O-antigen/teichoic acid export membrane protein